MLYLAAGSRKSPILFSFQVLSPLRSFLPHVVSFFRSLLFTTGIQVFGPRALLRGARCTFVLLSGPVWAFGGGHQPKAPGQFHCPAEFQSKNYGKKGVQRGVGWIRVGPGSVTADCHRFSPASSRSVLPLVEPQGRQMHLPEIHTPRPDAYLPPHLQGFTEMLHVPCTGVHLHSFKKSTKGHQAIFYNSLEF